MVNENNPNPLPEPPPVPAEDPTPEPLAPPPLAATLVVKGEVTDERVMAAERRAIEAERRAAELERDNQELKRIPAPVAAPVKKPKRWQFSPIIGADDEE